MRLGIVGRGRVAQALRTAFAETHEVRFGVRQPVERGEGPVADVADWAEAVILATPWQAEASVAEAIVAGTRAKAVIDATNPVGMVDGRLDLVGDRRISAAETLQARLPSAHIVKCLNQVGAEFLACAKALGTRPAMFAAGDDPTAKGVALQLAGEAGFEAFDGGPLPNARHLESLAMLWIWSALEGPLGRTFGFAVIRSKH